MRSLPIILLLSGVLFSLVSSAQLSIPFNSQAVNNNFRKGIQQIIEDFPNDFASTRGEIIAENPQSVDYVSLIIPEGMQESMITKYSAGSKDIYSWKATLLTTEDFSDAAKKYKWLFQQVNGMNVTYVVDQYTFRGKFQEPDESIGFASTILELAHAPHQLKKLKVEATMHFEFPEWKVQLLVFEQEREDDERGDETDGE